MDAGTTHDMVEDLMVELAIVRSNLFIAESEANRFKAHAIHAWFCKEYVCETCHDFYVEAKGSFGMRNE